MMFASFITISRLASAAEITNQVWVLYEGEIKNYDPSNWTVRNTVKVPFATSSDWRKFQITHTGEILFYHDPKQAIVNESIPRDKAWIWNGRAASLINCRIPEKSTSAGQNTITAVETIPRLSLSRDGRALYWFENEYKVLRSVDGPDLSVSTTFRVRKTDLDGKGSSQIASFSFPPCRCETGACPETCPEADVWFPEDGVDDFFIVTHYIPGQLGSTFQASFLYRGLQGKWSARKLAGALEDVLDAAQSGSTIIHRINDGGCCGWENEGDDQTLAITGGKSLVIFDERKQYSNPNYDVSFFTINAKRSPSGAFVATTIVSTARPGDESHFRILTEGKEDPNELARIRKSVVVLPMVEVFHISGPPTRSVSLPHATFMDWLNPREILIIENGDLVAFDVLIKARRISSIKMPKDANAFAR